VGVLERYARQMILEEFSQAGQERLLASRVAVIGCGALGSVISNHLVRSGVGRIKIIDRDYIELNNLQRQILFDEDDISRRLPKAAAAAAKLGRINSQVIVEPLVTDVNPRNIEEIIGDVDLVLDGTDNFETRYLINDACVKHRIPWVYAAVVSTYGMTFVIIPHRTPCFRCFMTEMPTPGSTPTCDMVGVLSTAVDIVASLAVTEGLKLLMGREDNLHNRLIYADAWTVDVQRLELNKGAGLCPACDQGKYDFLEAREGTYLTRLCGRGAVQINVLGPIRISFPDLAKRLSSVGQVVFNEYMLSLHIDPYEITVFPDGRAIIKGTTDEALARTLYARYIGL